MVLVSYKPYNYVSILQTKLGHREGHEARRMGLEAMPLDQHIEGGHGEREPCLKIRPHAVHDFLEVADERQHGKDCLHQHALLPLPPLTQFEVTRIALRGMEAGVTQDNHALLTLPNQPLQGIIRDIGGITRPRHHQAILVQQQAVFAPDNPAMVGEALAADLLRAAAFTHRMDQLDPIRVNDAEHRWGGQKGLCPVLMGLQEAKEPGALGEAGEQGTIVSGQPAIEGAVAHAFEGMEEPQGDHLTGPEVGLGMFGDGGEMVIDLAKEGRDKLDGGGHRLLRSWQGDVLSTSVEEVHGHDNKAVKYYWFI